jgi:YHS domain-containing protein
MTRVISPFPGKCRFRAPSRIHDVRKLILVNDLEIIPVLMQYDTHAEISFPLEQVDENAVTEWIDDRLVGFVKTCLSLHENDLYLKEEMAEDPVANVRFPKFAAGAKLEHQGRTFYFISEETRKGYAKANDISLA